MSEQHAEIKLTVPAETLQRLQAVATEQNMALDEAIDCIPLELTKGKKRGILCAVYE